MSLRTTDPVVAGDLAARGGVIVFPTDTLFGLGGDATDPGVAARIRAIKTTTDPRPFPILVSGVEALERVADPRVLERARALCAAFWPGALTLVVPLTPGGSALLGAVGRGPTAGLRCPDHPAARYLAGRVQGFLIGTSANRSGAPPPRAAAELDPGLAAEVDAVLDAGPPCRGTASSVLDLSGPAPVLLRAGAVTPEALRTWLPDLRMPG